VALAEFFLAVEEQSRKRPVDVAEAKEAKVVGMNAAASQG
jgi:hypothetical protein